jgi:hypothetical protein
MATNKRVLSEGPWAHKSFMAKPLGNDEAANNA